MCSPTRCAGLLLAWSVLFAAPPTHGGDDDGNAVRAERDPGFTRMAERSILFSSEIPEIEEIPLVPPVASFQSAGPPVALGGPRSCGSGCNHPWRGCCLRCNIDPAQPLGASLDAHWNTQIANGQVAQLVLYHCDFGDIAEGDGALVLNAYGEAKLRRLIPLLATTSYPLVVQKVVGAPEISELRRLQVVQFLTEQLHVPIAPERVLLGHPLMDGLRGVEAIEIDRNLLQQTRGQGAPPSNGTQGLSVGTGLFGLPQQ